MVRLSVSSSPRSTYASLILSGGSESTVEGLPRILTTACSMQCWFVTEVRSYDCFYPRQPCITHRAAACSGRQHGGYVHRVVRLLLVRHGGGTDLPRPVLPEQYPVRRRARLLHHAVRRVRRAADRRGDL